MKRERAIRPLKAVLLCAILYQGLVADEATSATVAQAGAMPLQSLGKVERNESFMVTCSDILSTRMKERFYAMGVDTIRYAQGTKYYFYMPVSLAQKIAQQDSVVSLTHVDPTVRKEPLHSGSLGLFGENTLERVNVLFLKEITQTELEELLLRNDIDATIEKVTPELRLATLSLRTKAYEKLAALPVVEYMDKVQKVLPNDADTPVHLTRNMKIAKYSDVAPLWQAPYKLNGRNMRIGVVDGGTARTTHREFGGRVHDRTKSGEVNFHATHVCGTIAAQGLEADAHGMANEAEVFSYSFDDSAFSEAVLDMYRKESILLSNHSYGYSYKERLGAYDTVAATQDMTVHNNPYITIFEAAGNDGVDPSYPEYGMIKGPANSKNILTIGALNAMSNDVAELSSTGPVKDGRIKPDLCVRGEYVTSASSESDTSYAMMSGTSMASPAAAGMGVLVAQAYKRVTGGYDIRHDTLKAVLVNTAVDIANPGPDYRAGFGRIDAKAAVDAVLTLSGKNPQINLSSVRHNGANSYKFTLSQDGYFKTTIAWIDPEANPSSAITLVNDIDMVLIDEESGKKYYPYTLDPANPARVAVQTRANHVDNIEQIEVKNLPAGIYRLVVKGTKIVTDTQEYTIASSLPLFASANVDILKPSKIQNFARKIFLSTF